ncbi:MAG: hypothetical protein ACRENB_14380 [Gemmatimonadales bacterium]
MISHRSVAALIVLSAPAFRLAAQSPWHAHIDLIAIHDYRWRGIKRASGWNAQLEGMARAGGRTTWLAAGVWNNVELGTHRNGAVSDLRPGHWGLSETDFWGELAGTFSEVDLAAGFIWYEYRGRAGRIGTGEVYGRLRGSGRNPRKLAPEVSLWYDVVERNSGYLEAGVTAPVLALPLRGVGLLAYASGNAGFAIGEPDRPSALAATTFDRPGFTSAELSVGLRMDGQKSMAGLILRVAGHLMYADDAATRRRRIAPPEASGWLRPYLTLGLGIRWPAPRDQ